MDAAPPLMPRGLIVSPIAGRDGNHEYLLWLAPSATTESGESAAAWMGVEGERAIERVVEEALNGAGPATA